jgi:hypothetical protein
MAMISLVIRTLLIFLLTNNSHHAKLSAYFCQVGFFRMAQKKWMTQAEAWRLANKLAAKFGSIQAVAEKIGCATSTIYRWENGRKTPPDGRYTIALKDLAIQHGIVKA